MVTEFDAVPKKLDPLGEQKSFENSPSYMPALRETAGLTLLSVPTFYELQASGRNMVDLINRSSKEARKNSRHRI